MTVTREELGQLYERYGFLVHRRCVALLGDAQEANDALQETFMRVQRYPPREVRSILAWLYGVALRVCIDQAQRAGRAESWPEQLIRKAREIGGPAAEERPISIETRLSVAQELAKLDEKSREIAVLHFFEGMTQEEIAVRTGYSRKTVGLKLRTAEERLRDVFETLFQHGGVEWVPR